MRSTLSLFFCLFAVLISDQITKAVVLSNLSPRQVIEVFPGFFNLTLTFNPGIAFGVFSSLPAPYRDIVISAAILTALGTVIYFHLRYYKSDRLAQFAIGAVIGGALGNVIDRLRIGKVVDFLDFYAGSVHWPAFNVADSAVCIGVALLLFRPTHSAHNTNENSQQ